MVVGKGFFSVKGPRITCRKLPLLLPSPVEWEGPGITPRLECLDWSLHVVTAGPSILDVVTDTKARREPLTSTVPGECTTVELHF